MSRAFDPITVGRMELGNRIVMAPMTRSRANGADQTATPLMAEYYVQRAGAGLIITEGTQPSVIGQGYPNTPGLHSEAQIDAWRKVTSAVHDAGGLICAQLMHTGRIGHPDLYQEPLTPVGPSAVAAGGSAFTAEGFKAFVNPEPLSPQDITTTTEDFAAAARNAITAGFDGVEVHGAHGYLPHQFMSTNANQRDDEWGGSVEGRIRFTVAVSRAVADAIGPDRVGLRVSPANPFNDIVEDGHVETYPALVRALNPLGLAYLHVAETTDPALTPQLRALWDGVFMLNPATPGSHTGPEALKLIDDGAADLVSFARLFISNPDLPVRLAAGGPYTEPDMSKAYGGDHRGYTDYPPLVLSAA
ncbi:MAG: alkene reductase [Solirubrobacterales bacterium]|nr:alkene reductase [Solirubrobacterales bacterium]